MAKKAPLKKANGRDIQHAAEQFLYRQSELLDSKKWQDWIDLFTDDGIYWMPPEPSHTPTCSDLYGTPIPIVPLRAMT